MSLELEIDLSKNKIENQENENIIMKILEKSGFVITKDISELNGIMIPRDLLINDEKYDTVKEYLVKLKKHKMFSSTFLTSLHKDADKKQKVAIIEFSSPNIKGKSFQNESN